VVVEQVGQDIDIAGDPDLGPPVMGGDSTTRSAGSSGSPACRVRTSSDSLRSSATTPPAGAPATIPVHAGCSAATADP
jgi:hypothetical protein